MSSRMPAPKLFDRALIRRRRARAAATLDNAAFLIDEIVLRLVERLDEIRRPLGAVLVLGSHGGRLARAVAAQHPEALVVETDVAARMLGGPGQRVVADEELLPFAAGRFDAVLSAGVLHRVDDLPGVLAQARWSLKADGLLLAAFAGGETLSELRRALMVAETELEGGAGPRVAPFIEVRDAGALLQRAGFALPMADLDRIRVSYRQPLGLLRDLRAMGESNALIERPQASLRRETLAAAMAGYPRDADGSCPATFDIVFLTGWKPHEGQPRPAPRGSGTVDLAAALRSDRDEPQE